MKKLLTLILCLAMVLTVFVGCSSTPATEEGASASAPAPAVKRPRAKRRIANTRIPLYSP